MLFEIRDGAGRAGDQAAMGSITIGGTTSIQSGGGTITLRADNGLVDSDMSFISAGSTGQVIIEGYSQGATIDLGAAGTGDQFINGTIVGAITADSLVIGSETAGTISIEDSFALAFNNNTIQTGGDIIFNQGDVDGITADSLPLNLNAGGQVVGSGSATGTDLVGGAGAELSIDAVTGIDVSTNYEQLSFNNTGEGAVRIDGRGGTLSLLGGNNAATGAATTVASAGDISVDGAITHSADSAALTLDAAQGITVNDNITGGGGGTTLILSGTANGIGIFSATISDSGGVVVNSGTSVFANSGAIDNTGSTNNIEIIADDINFSPASSIDAGPDAVTMLRRSSTGDWALGDGSVLTSDELNTIQNNIAIGDDTGSISTATIGGAIGLTGGQNISIQTAAGIDFAQGGAFGITGAGMV
jgi:hypothetical protein